MTHVITIQIDRFIQYAWWSKLQTPDENTIVSEFVVDNPTRVGNIIPLEPGPNTMVPRRIVIFV